MRRILILILSLFISVSLFAIDAKTIVDNMDDAMDFETSEMNATMVSEDRLGATTVSFRAYEKGNGDTHLVVTSGPDRGQKILRLDDDIYIYYPDADEIIRLSGSSLGNSFLGSDFSYEDLSGDDDYESRYTYTLDGNEEYEGIDCYKMTFTAKKLSETYQKEIVLIDSSRFVPLKSELYSKTGRLLKTIYYSDYVLDSGTYFPTKVLAVNAVKRNSSTSITVENVVFNAPIDPSLFDRNNLAW